MIKNISKSLNDAAGYAASFLPSPKELTKNALEGALLSGVITVGPHIFNKYVGDSIPVLMDLPSALAWTATGAVAYTAYKTTVKPAGDRAYSTLSSIPKNISDFSGSLFAKKDTDEVKKTSFYSLSIWRLGTLALFGYSYNHLSQLPVLNEQPVVPIVLSAAGTLGASWALQSGIRYVYDKTTKQIEDSKIIGKTSEAVQHLWDFSTSTLKAGAVGLGIVGAGAVAARLTDIFNSEPVTASAQATETVLNIGSQAINFGAGIFKSAFDTASQGVGILSGLIFREETLKQCAEESFKAQNDFLCTNAGRIDTAANATFEYVLKPLHSNLGSLGTGIYAAAQTASSGTQTAWSFAGGKVQDLTAFFTAADGTGKLVIDQALNIAQDPTVQKGAMITAAAGASLFALHFLATKARAYFAKSDVPAGVEEELDDIEAGLSVPTTITPSAPHISLMTEETITRPAPLLLEPSAPPMTPEMERDYLGPSSLAATLEPLRLPITDPFIAPVIAEPIETTETTSTATVEEAPVMPTPTRVQSQPKTNILWAGLMAFRATLGSWTSSAFRAIYSLWTLLTQPRARH